MKGLFLIGNFWGKDFALSRGGNKLIVRGLGEIRGDRGFWEGFGCGGWRGFWIGVWMENYLFITY